MKLDAHSQQNGKTAQASHAKYQLELERLKAAQLQEAKRLADELEAKRDECAAEKAKIREENASLTNQYLQDYRAALEREQALEQQLKDKEKADLMGSLHSGEPYVTLLLYALLVICT